MSEKRHPPTRRRLREARRRGEVAFSKDVASTGVFVVVLVGLWLGTLPALEALRSLWLQATSGPMMARPDERLAELLGHALQVLLWCIVGLTALAALAGIAASFFQIGGVMAWERVKPDAKRMNPAEGLKRLFSSRNLIGLLKTVVKTLLLGALVFVVVRSSLQTALQLGHAQPAAIMEATGRLLLATFAWGVVIYVAMSGFDYAHMHYEHIKGLRMSVDDLRRDHKEAEGDPTHRSRRRFEHWEAVYFSLADRVRAASAVIHANGVAVALQYLGPKDLPRVVAKGEGELAAQIRQIAGEALIPMQADAELAARLNEEVGLDMPVPRALYGPVARLLRWAEGGG